MAKRGPKMPAAYTQVPDEKADAFVHGNKDAATEPDQDETGNDNGGEDNSTPQRAARLARLAEDGPNAKKKSRIPIPLEADLERRVRVRMVSLGMSLGDAVDEGLRLWLKKHEPK